MRDLADIFAADGPLAAGLPDFVPRPSQVEMAEAVAAALEGGSALLIEAGTGTGKTFAYLVPALLSGRRILLSTGTRTLQDQLYAKDVPLVGGALGLGARIALLKGRANYLCLQRLDAARLQSTLDETRAATLARIAAWSQRTRTGDLAEVPELGDADPVLPLVTSTRENCLGQRCPQFPDCHVFAARRRALEADVVIVNHHLLLADLALKEDGFGDLLGAADAVILDEAHQIPDLATQCFGASVGSRQIEAAIEDTRREFALPLKEAEDALRELQGGLPRGLGRVDWNEAAAVCAAALERLTAALRAVAAELSARATDSGPGPAAARFVELAARIERIVLATDEEGARTFDRTSRGFTLGLLPFDISERFRGIVEGRRCAWIFTSATLSLGADFGHFAGRLGLEAAASLKIESPFDYAQQALLYLPPRMPDPASPGFLAAVIEVAVPLIDTAQGGAFLLFTSHRALARAALLLRERWGGSERFRLLVQGEGPRERLLTEFRASGHCVLLGTTSFWEGVDVKGQALRLVVLEKLPFASPDDPLTKARIAFLRAQGGNPFRDFQLPEAALALKQGVGRLIRSEEDRGVVAICDPRMSERGYGRLFRANLPPMRVSRDPEDALRFLRQQAPPVRARAPAA
jgi:ATP-dependent DNA helicase DinG